MDQFEATALIDRAKLLEDEFKRRRAPVGLADAEETGRNVARALMDSGAAPFEYISRNDRAVRHHANDRPFQTFAIDPCRKKP
eukprot:COSAG04_NODE_7271_length_1156_cov_1.254494_3_plen_82_part_01